MEILTALHCYCYPSAPPPRSDRHQPDHSTDPSSSSGNSSGSTTTGHPAAASAAAAAHAEAAASALDATRAGRYTRADLRRVCCALATAEYCLDTVQQLEDKLREKIDAPLRGRIDLGDERDAFHRIIAQCIQLLVGDLVAGCDVALAAMVRIQWQQVSIL